jgi:hypothetical protein
VAYTYRMEKTGATLGSYGVGKVAGEAAEGRGELKAIEMGGDADEDPEQ